MYVVVAIAAAAAVAPRALISFFPFDFIFEFSVVIYVLGPRVCSFFFSFFFFSLCVYLSVRNIYSLRLCVRTNGTREELLIAKHTTNRSQIYTCACLCVECWKIVSMQTTSEKWNKQMKATTKGKKKKKVLHTRKERVKKRNAENNINEAKNLDHQTNQEQKNRARTGERDTDYRTNFGIGVCVCVCLRACLCVEVFVSPKEVLRSLLFRFSFITAIEILLTLVIMKQTAIRFRILVFLTCFCYVHADFFPFVFLNMSPFG